MYNTLNTPIPQDFTESCHPLKIQLSFLNKGCIFIEQEYVAHWSKCTSGWSVMHAHALSSHALHCMITDGRHCPFWKVIIVSICMSYSRQALTLKKLTVIFYQQWLLHLSKHSTGPKLRFPTCSVSKCDIFSRFLHITSSGGVTFHVNEQNV